MSWQNTSIKHTGKVSMNLISECSVSVSLHTARLGHGYAAPDGRSLPLHVLPAALQTEVQCNKTKCKWSSVLILHLFNFGAEIPSCELIMNVFKVYEILGKVFIFKQLEFLFSSIIFLIRIKFFWQSLFRIIVQNRTRKREYYVFVIRY